MPRWLGSSWNVADSWMSALSAFTSGWIIRSQCVSVPRLDAFCCVRLARCRDFPRGLSTSVCLHPETNTWERRPCGSARWLLLSPPPPPACNLRCKVKHHHHFQPTGWETQVSADTNHLFTQPVCLFDTCRLWFTSENTARSSVLACIAGQAHRGLKHTSAWRSMLVCNAAVDLPLQGPLVSLLGHSASVAPF